MTAGQLLFEHYPDWLSFTLAQPEHGPMGRHTILPDGARVQLLGPGILWLTPAEQNQEKGLIVSAGIHGNETAPIEVLNRLVTELIEERWHLASETLLILGNGPAMVAGRRFVEHNLNRLFNGAHKKAPYAGSAEAERAAVLEQICELFAQEQHGLVHYDLHTAIRPSKREKFALYPFIPDRKLPQDQLRFLSAAKVHTLLLQHTSGTTFSAFSAQTLGAESMTIELGQVKPFGENDLSRFRGIEEALRKVMSGQPLGLQANADDVVIFEVVEEILNTGPDFRFHVPDDAANFTEFEPGEVIWEDQDHCYKVGPEPEAIVFPNRDVPEGHRVGLLVRRKSP